MTDAETIVSAAASAALGFSPLIIKLVISLTNPYSSVMDAPERVEALEASHRALLLSQDCVARVADIGQTLSDTDLNR